MSWKQIKDADMNVGYTGGWCLKYVQDAFGTDHPFPSAIDAWNADFGNGNHADEIPPLGITVPVYFSLGNVPAGHVAIRLDDGWVASSTQPGVHPKPYYHKSLDDLIAVYGRYNGGATLLGWSEFVGTQKVVEFIPDVVLATTDQIQQVYQELLGRDADPDGLAHYQNFTIEFVRQDLLNSDEYKNRQIALQAAANPVTAPVHNPDPTPILTPVVPEPVDTPVIELPVTPVVIPTPIVPPTPVTPVSPIKTPIAKVTWLTIVVEFIKKLLRIKHG